MDDIAKRNNQKALIGIFLTLLFIIIVLVVVIIVVSNKQNTPNDPDNTNDTTTEVSLPEELTADGLSPTDQVIKETSIMLQDPNYSNADIEAYYDSVIKDALSTGNTDLATKIIIQKMNFLAITENDCEKAQNYVSDLDLSPYSINEQGYLASYIISMASSCENQELQTKWENFYDNIRYSQEYTGESF